MQSEMNCLLQKMRKFYNFFIFEHFKTFKMKYSADLSTVIIVILVKFLTFSFLMFNCLNKNERVKLF